MGNSRSRPHFPMRMTPAFTSNDIKHDVLISNKHDIRLYVILTNNKGLIILYKLQQNFFS